MYANRGSSNSMIKKVVLLLCLIGLNIHAFRFHYVEPLQIKKGHLALPTSQEVGPLYAFGQNIVDKHNKQLFVYTNSLLGKEVRFTEVRPSFLYGITDYFSLFSELPIALQNKPGNQKPFVESITFQLEYALFDVNTITGSYQWTIVGNVNIPLSNNGAVRPTGAGQLVDSGSTSFLIGTTACYMGVDWYFFTCQGGIITTTRNHTKTGNGYLYQFGASRSIGDYPGWIFAAMFEAFGHYSWRDTMNGVVDANSGGNIIYAGPSFWASSDRFIGQVGVAYAVVQNLFGNQSKMTWYPAVDLGWKF